MIEVGSRVIVPAYSVPNDETQEVLEAQEQERVGTVSKIMGDGQNDPDGYPLPRSRRWCFVLLDDPLGNNEVRQCGEHQLIELDEGNQFFDPSWKETFYEGEKEA